MISKLHYAALALCATTTLTNAQSQQGAAVLSTLGATFGNSGLRITEYMYKGTDGEFFELTNTTGTAIDLTGWSMDDDSAVPGTFDLSPAGVLGAGASMVVTEADGAVFSTAWGLSGVTVLGLMSSANLGRNDQINIYDAGGQLVDVLTFGDESFVGSIRTDSVAGEPCHDTLGMDDCYAWSLAAAGDAWGSVTSTGGDLGNPGSYTIVPCDGPVGINYCTALVNQSGTTATISATGTAAASMQDLTLSVTGANPSQSGLFYLGHNEISVPFSYGIRCAGGGVVRISPALVTDGTGSAARVLDFNGVYGGELTAGATVYFQFWYRDLDGSNYSDGLRVDFY